MPENPPQYENKAMRSCGLAMDRSGNEEEDYGYSYLVDEGGEDDDEPLDVADDALGFREDLFPSTRFHPFCSLPLGSLGIAFPPVSLPGS